jgi:hypothetical protein
MGMADLIGAVYGVRCVLMFARFQYSTADRQLTILVRPLMHQPFFSYAKHHSCPSKGHPMPIEYACTSSGVGGVKAARLALFVVS